MRKQKGQNIAEYSILIALIIAAAVAMQVYVKRGMQGRIADAVDYAPGGGNDAGLTWSFPTKQYEPYYADTNAIVSSNRAYDETLGNRGLSQRANMNETTTREASSYERNKATNQWDREQAAPIIR